jgi:hypothetical protein
MGITVFAQDYLIVNLQNAQAVYRLTAKLLLGLANAMILGSEFHGTHDHILLSDGSGSLQSIFVKTD